MVLVGLLKDLMRSRVQVLGYVVDIGYYIEVGEC